MAIKFERLTRTALRKLATGEHLTEHCITARRMASGDVSYSINIMVDGQRIHRAIGRERGGMTPHAALDAIAALRTKSREESLDLPKARKNHLSFSEAGESYLERIEGNPKLGRNLNRKALHIRRHLASFFGPTLLTQINDKLIAKYVMHRRTAGMADPTINRELSTLSHLLSCCVEWGQLNKRPKIDKCPESPKKINVLSREEQARLTEAAIHDQDPLTYLFVVIAAGTGMRHSEILRIQWDDIEFNKRRIYVGKAKAGQRTQPITQSLSEMLRAEFDRLEAPSGYLFPTQGRNPKQPYRTTMASQFKRCVIRAGLDPAVVTPHILRHTMITQLVEANVDLPTIQKVSGHKTLGMVLRYTQLSDEHVDESMSVLDDHAKRMITLELHHSPSAQPLSDDRMTEIT